VALSNYKTFVAGEVLTAADMNGLQSHFTGNALTLISPLTGALDANGQEIILDADADSSITVDTDDRLDIRLQGQDLFRFDGTTASSVNGATFGAAATGNPVSITAQGSDTNIGVSIIGKGTGSILLDASPSGTGVDIDGAPLVLDADADTSLRETADDVLALRMQGVDVFIFDGNVASPANGFTLTSSATGVSPELSSTGSDSNINLRLTPKGTGQVTVGSTDIEVFDYTYGVTGANQNISAATETDLTSLTALDLPNVTGTLTSRRFMVMFNLSLTETSGAANLIQVKVYNGSNGTKADTLVYAAARVLPASALLEQISGQIRFTPGASGRTKLGLALTSGGTCTVGGTNSFLSNVIIREVT
jgi:hypothetical protein